MNNVNVVVCIVAFVFNKQPLVLSSPVCEFFKVRDRCPVSLSVPKPRRELGVVQSLGKHHWMNDVLNQVSANFLNKGLDSKYLGLYRPGSLCTNHLALLFFVCKWRHRLCINEWVRQYSNKTLFKTVSRLDLAWGPWFADFCHRKMCSHCVKEDSYSRIFLWK